MVIEPSSELVLVGDLKEVAAKDLPELAYKAPFSSTLLPPKHDSCARSIPTRLLHQLRHPTHDVAKSLIIPIRYDILDMVLEQRPITLFGLDGKPLEQVVVSVHVPVRIEYDPFVFTPFW